MASASASASAMAMRVWSSAAATPLSVGSGGAVRASFGRLAPLHSHAPLRADGPHPHTSTPPSSSSSSPSAATPVSPAAGPGAAAVPPASSSSSSSGGGSRSRTSSGSGSSGGARKSRNSTTLQYLVGLGVLVLGASWAAIPLYRIFCARTGFGGTTAQDKDGSKLAALKPGKREVVVTFNADVSPFMHWKFVPSQPRLKVRLGEPVLAFYKATNLRDKAVTGVATYNVTPNKTGSYFHKIQCFCFDEQRLRANETVDMPVFFYIDPAMEADPKCNDVSHLTLSYTFFPVEDDEDDTRTEEEKDAAGGLKLHGSADFPLPGATATDTNEPK